MKVFQRSIILGFATLLVSLSSFAKETCYDFSKNQMLPSPEDVGLPTGGIDPITYWLSKPNQICLEPAGPHYNISIRQFAKETGQYETVTTSKYRVTHTIKTNDAIIGVEYGDPYTFSESSLPLVKFSGERNYHTRVEAGTLTLGNQEYFYKANF